MSATRRLRLVNGHLAEPEGTVKHQTTAAEQEEAEYESLPTPEAIPEAPLSDQFYFSCDGGALTLEQRRFYEENGFIIIRGMLPKEKLDVYRKRFVDICNKKIEPSTGMTLVRDVSIAKRPRVVGEEYVTKLQEFQEDPVLFDFCKDEAVLKYVRSFTGPNIKAIHTMVINKPPHAGKTGRHPLHQDMHYFPIRPANRVVAAWCAIDHCHRENGCLVAIPGTHRSPLLEHDYPDFDSNIAYHGIAGMSKEQIDKRVHLDMMPGDCVFFHPHLIHGSGYNKTKGYRKSISGHFASASCQMVEVKGTSQEVIANEIQEMALKKIGTDIPFSEIFSLRSRLVAGEEGDW